MKNILNATLCTASLILTAATALAQTANADGVIRKLDLEAHRVVIKHGDWQGVNMPAMTMPFLVRDQKLLADLKVNDAVHFSMEQAGHDWVITQMARTEPPSSVERTQ